MQKLALVAAPVGDIDVCILYLSEIYNQLDFQHDAQILQWMPSTETYMD